MGLSLVEALYDKQFTHLRRNCKYSLSHVLSKRRERVRQDCTTIPTRYQKKTLKPYSEWMFISYFYNCNCNETQQEKLVVFQDAHANQVQFLALNDVFVDDKLIHPDVQVLVSTSRLDFLLIYILVCVLKQMQYTFGNVSAYLKLYVLFPPLIRTSSELLLSQKAFIMAIMYVFFLISLQSSPSSLPQISHYIAVFI